MLHFCSIVLLSFLYGIIFFFYFKDGELCLDSQVPHHIRYDLLVVAVEERILSFDFYEYSLFSLQ